MIRRWNILSWPIWAKLLAGFIVAVLLPTLLMLTVVVRGIREIDQANAESAVSQFGAQQAQALAGAFALASNNLTDYSQAASFRSLLLELVTAPTGGDTGAGADPLDQARMVGSMQDDLLNRSSSTFTRLDLLDASGQLLVRALPGRGIEVTLGEDLAQSAAYRAGALAYTRGQTQATAVTASGGQPVIEIVTVLYRFQAIDSQQFQLPIAYLVAQLNPAFTVYDKLPAVTSPDQPSSYLVSRSGVLIKDGAASASAGAELAGSELMQAALSGQPQFDRLNPGTPDEVVRFAALIENTPLILISERPANTVANQMLDYLLTRGFPLLLGLTPLVLVLVLLFNQFLTPPLRRLTQAMQAAGRGSFSGEVPDTARADEIGDLARAFADMRQEIGELVQGLSHSVSERERDISATQDISHFAATQRDLQYLIDRVVNLVTDRFANIYHAQIFLLDNEARFAVLRASTGAAGTTLLARGHRLEVGSRSVIGQVTSLGQVVVARDIGTSDIHRRNEFLPDTRAELAVPLRVGDRVIGALDVQSYQRDTFTADQIRVLEIMADQIAIAIENARLFQQTQRQATDDERRQRALTRHTWSQYLYDQRQARLESVAGQTANPADLESLRQTAAERGAAVVGAPSAHHTIGFAVPIRLRGETLGAVAWEVAEAGFDRNKVLLAQELTDRLAISLENARLFTQSQRATERERLVNEISTRLTGQTDIDRILRTAVREVGQALRVPQVSIHLHAPAEALPDGGAERANGRASDGGSTNGSTNGHSEAS